MNLSERRVVIRERILDLCRERGPEKSICPSDVARSLADDEADWRPMMDEVRAMAVRLAEEGRIDVCQKGKVVDIAQAKGPIRLRWRG